MLKIYYAKVNKRKIDISNLPNVVREHIETKKNQKVKDVSICTWNLLDEIIYQNYQSHLNDCKIWFSENGKPFIDKCYFSLSHTGDIITIAISSYNIGVDIEEIKPKNNLERLVSTLFEKPLDSSCDKLESLYYAFTAYEANVKFNDQKLGYPKRKLKLDDKVISFKVEVEKKKFVISYRSQRKIKCEIIDWTNI